MPVDFTEYDPEEDQGFRLTEGTNAYDILQHLANHPIRGSPPRRSARRQTSPGGVSASPSPDSKTGASFGTRGPTGQSVRTTDSLHAGMLASLETIEDRDGDDNWKGWEEIAVDPREIDE